ncbi:MAG: alpha-amylase family glycosyl hydrolase [Prevotella sp.]|jgi:glycosidase
MKSFSIEKLCFVTLLLLSFGYSGSVQADYIDDINADVYGRGQQVIYEMNVGSYTAEGTFAAAEQRLDDLKLTGVDIVWLMPIYPRGGGIDSPYAATDFKAVNPAYGTVADLRSFVDAAHAKGMKVWLDWVPNHTATNAKWVSSHPEYYKTSGGQMVHPSNYGDVYQLNYNNADLVEAMNDCLKYWIDVADIDGYRCDYISSKDIPVSYWQNTIPMLKNYKSGKEIVMLGESDFTDSNNMRLQSAGFDYDYAWGFQTKLEKYGAAGVYANPLKVYCTDLIEASKQMDVARMVYVTSHDMNWNEEKKTLSSKYGQNRYLLTVLSYTLWGMPMIYNGMETGGNQALNYFEDTKIDWTQTDSKMLNTIRTLAALKHTQTALHDGAKASDNASVEFLSTTNSNQYILAYRRTAGNSEVIVLLNTGTTAQTALLTGINGTYSQWLNSESIAKGVSRHSFNFTGNLSVSVPAKGYLVYVKGSYSEEDTPPEKPISNLVDNDAYSVYYESPVDNATVCGWMWGDVHSDGAYYASTGSWPGDEFARVGITTEGNVIYKLKLNITADDDMPDNIIITENGSDDAHKVVDTAPFVNHGYYMKGQSVAVKEVPTSIAAVAKSRRTESNAIYNLSGQRVDRSYQGIVIAHGKKYIQR